MMWRVRFWQLVASESAAVAAPEFLAAFSQRLCAEKSAVASLPINAPHPPPPPRLYHALSACMGGYPNARLHLLLLHTARRDMDGRLVFFSSPVFPCSQVKSSYDAAKREMDAAAEGSREAAEAQVAIETTKAMAAAIGVVLSS